MRQDQIQKTLLWGFPVLFFCLSFNLPFWGDGIASVSKAAVRIYLEGLQRPWNYPSADPGHPTLFPWLIALCWKLFGFHLWVPHLLVAIQLHLLARIMMKISELASERAKTISLLLIFISPLTVSQALGISLQLPLTLCFFAAFFYLERNRTGLAIFIMCLMMLVHLQAALLYAALVLYDTWKNGRRGLAYLPRLLALSIPGWVFLAWGYFHMQEFGWTFFTPNYERGTPGLSTIIYNLAISAWRLFDLGYILIVIPAFLLGIRSFKGERASGLARFSLLSFLVLCIGIPVIFAYPPNHRYIFPVYLLAALLFAKWLESLAGKKNLWIGFTAFGLLLGNFWFYPGKCQGDQNLVHLEFHRLEKELINDLGKDPVIVHSYAPLNNNGLFTWLDSQRSPLYTDLYNRSFDSLTFIVESNLNCEFTAADRAILEKDFFVKSYEGRAVFINLYLNKKYAAQYPHLAVYQPHQKGFLEQKVQDIKKFFGR